jgi:predicted DCC family thiol-disulfide oxidoreductase YuxK
MINDNKNIIFFDGVCNVCNGYVNFVIRRNKKRDLYFTSLQSGFAKQFLSKMNMDASEMSTIYFYKAGNLYSKSTAVLQICKHLTAPYPFFAAALLLVNRRLRDFFYERLAANRYKLWGKRETCRLPTPDERKMFLL